ncbi:amino acid adenylation domain-containing protein [Deltaproteobacteria bacterium TL4]
MYGITETTVHVTYKEFLTAGQYRDYIAWYQQQDQTKAHNFWKENLRGFSSPTPLTFELNAEPTTDKYMEVSLQWSEEKTKELQRFLAEQHLTLNTLMEGAWAMLLSRYSGENDVVFGSVVSGRPPELPAIESTAGLFINTLAARVKLEPERTLSSWLQQLQMEHQQRESFSFSALTEIQAGSELPTGTPLFETVMIVENYPMNQLLRQESENLLRLEDVKMFEQVNYPLSLIVLPDKQLSFSLAYYTSKFSSSTINTLLKHLDHLLEQIILRDVKQLKDLSLLTEEESYQQLVAWNGSRVKYPDEKCIHHLFEEWAEKTPDTVALIWGKQSLTYRQLNEKANQVAHHLQSLYLEVEDVVGVCMDRSLEMIVGLLGILKAGGCYLPLDPAQPKDRLGYMLQEANAKILLTQSHLKEELPATDIPKIHLDQHELFANNLAHNPQSLVKPENLAYLIYTSGSTGLPKGVLVEHTGFVNMANYHIQRFELNGSDRVIQFASISFDASMLEIGFALLSGGGLVLVSKETIDHPHQFVAYLKEHQVTTIAISPVYLHVLDKSKLTTLRTVITGGEAPVREDALYFSERIQCYNSYGPTETSVCATLYKVKPEDAKRGSIPLGSPFANTSIVILDENQQLVPTGVTGELYLGGVGVARGYLNQPVLTQEKFVSLAMNPGVRYFKSGDLGCWLKDGTLKFMGRKDDQVKVSGHRIELGEIESLLLRHTSVKETAVITQKGSNGQDQLVAYFVRNAAENNDFEILQQHLKRHLSEFLPTYMIPAFFMEMEQFPMTVSRKIDKKALPEIKANSVSSSEHYLAPRNVIEQSLVDILQTLLGKEKLGIEENFFHLGLDSIKAIQLVARLHQQSLNAAVRDIFEYPTVNQLAAHLKTKPQGMVIDQNPVTGPIPLTAIQQWFFQSMEPKHYQHFNQAFMLRSSEALDQKLLQAVLQALLDHHDALRIQYKFEDKMILQENRNIGIAFPLDFVDLCDSDNPTQQMEAYCARSQTLFDLEKGLLFKAVLFRHPEGDRLLLLIHHLVIDGVSWRILIEDLATAYSQLGKGEPLLLPAKTSSFQAWSEAIQQYSISQELLAEQNYWGELAATRVLALPYDREITPNTPPRHETETLCLSTEQTKQLLHEVHSTYNTGMDDLLLTALGRAIKQWTENSKTWIMLESHGREQLFPQLNISRTVGWFTTMYPVLLDLSKYEEVGMQLQHIKETLKSVPNNGLGFGILNYVTPSAVVNPTIKTIEPQILFNYLGELDQDLSQESFSLANDSLGETVAPGVKSPYSLLINGSVNQGQLQFQIAYNQQQYQKATIRQLASQFQAELQTLIQHCLHADAEITPSDLTYKGLDIDALDDIISGLN